MMASNNITFDTNELVELAVEKSALDDFGDLPYREGLSTLCETYDRHVRDPDGRRRLRRRVLDQLITRLRCEDAFKRIPEIAEQPITAPVFVTGLPRSGTSALLNLLTAAPANRGLLQWEVQFPDPWPGSHPGEEDPRYQALAAALKSPENSHFRKIHYIDADTPEECVMLHAFAFSGVQLGFEIMLEPYGSWLKAQDLTPLYTYQRKQMQMLNWRRPGQQWMLKAPAHMLGIASIMTVFPDARFIWCHRHPKHVVPSINSMNQAIMNMYMGDCEHIDILDMGTTVMDWYATSLERGLEERSRFPERRFVDCSQQEFVDRPLELSARIHTAFELAESEAGRSAIRQHIADNPKGKHGKHDYDLAAFGLSETPINDRFAFYLSDGRWPLSE